MNYYVGMNRVLITTDFTHHSKNAIKVALELFNDFQKPCHIVLVNTYLVPEVHPDLLISTNDQLRKISKAGLEQDREEALKLNKNPLITFETISQMGSLTNVTLQTIEKHKIDLVVMGKNGGKHVDLVSALLKKQGCPLLITYATKS